MAPNPLKRVRERPFVGAALHRRFGRLGLLGCFEQARRVLKGRDLAGVLRPRGCGGARYCGTAKKPTDRSATSFSTCQVRVVRFYVSCRRCSPLLLSSPLPRLVLLNCEWRMAAVSLPDLNRKCRTAVFPAGLQLPAPDGSVPRRTSTASSGRQCSLPGLNHELRRAVFSARPQLPAPDGSVPAEPQQRVNSIMSGRMSKDMPKRTSKGTPERLSEEFSPERTSE